jgi:plastocyanin
MRSILAIVLVASVVAPAAAGSIRGSIRLPAPPVADATFRPYAGRASSLPAPTRPARGLPGDAVVYVEALPAGAPQPAAQPRPQLAQRGQSFEPRVVVVAAGDEVEFPNFDPIYHNVFSVSPARRFDLGKYPRGQSRTVRFPKAGLVNVFCDIHADMAAFILVTPTRAWTRATADGRFELGGLAAGRYRVHWWHPDFAGGTSDVEVPADGAAALEVTF